MLSVCKTVLDRIVDDMVQHGLLSALDQFRLDLSNPVILIPLSSKF